MCGCEIKWKQKWEIPTLDEKYFWNISKWKITEKPSLNSLHFAFRVCFSKTIFLAVVFIFMRFVVLHPPFYLWWAEKKYLVAVPFRYEPCVISRVNSLIPIQLVFVCVVGTYVVNAKRVENCIDTIAQSTHVWMRHSVPFYSIIILSVNSLEHKYSVENSNLRIARQWVQSQFTNANVPCMSATRKRWKHTIRLRVSETIQIFMHKITQKFGLADQQHTHTHMHFGLHTIGIGSAINIGKFREKKKTNNENMNRSFSLDTTWQWSMHTNGQEATASARDCRKVFTVKVFNTRSYQFVFTMHSGQV